MQPAETALARSRAYALFSRLYRHGLTPALRAATEAVPPLAEAVPDAYHAEDAAADHHRIFGLNVFPYAGVFLDEDGMLGGAPAEHARRLLHEAGHAVPPTAESPDALVHALDGLAFLTAAEADAWSDGRPDEAERVRPFGRRLFDAYLLWWLPAFTFAVQRQGHPFYAALADLTLEVTLDHRLDLGREEDPSPPLPLPAPPALLNDEGTGLRDIAAYLTTPAWSGLYLSRDDLARLGRTEELPHGFGGRARMLTTLLRSAAEYDRLEALLGALTAHLHAWRRQYEGPAWQNPPVLHRVAKAWRTRLGTTEEILQRIEEAAAQEQPPPR